MRAARWRLASASKWPSPIRLSAIPAWRRTTAGPSPAASYHTREPSTSRKPLSRELAFVRFLLAAGLVLAQEPGQLGSERVTGGNVELVAERVAPPLELTDVRLRLLVLGDRLAHLPLVRLSRSLEVTEVDVGAEELREPARQRERRLRACRERGVVRNRGPQAGRRHPRTPARVVKDADDPGRPLVARGGEAEL